MGKKYLIMAVLMSYVGTLSYAAAPSLSALEKTNQVPDPEMPPLTGILLKRAGDILRYRKGDSGQSRNYY